MQPKLILIIQASMRGLASGQIKYGILVFRQATAHISGLKPNQHCRAVAASAIFANLFWDKTRALPGIICKYGRNFMKRVSKCRRWATQTHSHIILRQNINSLRNFSARSVGTSNSSATSIPAWEERHAGVGISGGSASPPANVFRRTHDGSCNVVISSRLPAGAERVPLATG